MIQLNGKIYIGHLDNDTSYSSDTFNAALYAAGAGILAVDQNGVNRNAFCAIRPVLVIMLVQMVKKQVYKIQLVHMDFVF